MENVSKHGEPAAKETADVLVDKIEQLKQIFPEAIAEGKVDFEKLRAALGDFGEERPERYSFSWAGKREAIGLLQAPSRATLIPAKDESIDFDATNHLFIEGDNLEVLKLLYKPYFGRVKMIYIDPPYNTGNDFVYPDNYTDPLDTYLRLTGQKDGDGNLLTSNPNTNGRYHSVWLSMMYPRLLLARQLLREDGVIFVSIDDTEVANLRLLMNEVFGEENFLACVVWQHSVQPKGYLGKFSVHHNYLLCHQKSEQFTLEALERTAEHNRNYSNPDKDPKGEWRPGDVRNALYRANLIFDIKTPSGKVIKPPKNGWRWSRETIAKKIETGEIVFSEDETRIIRKIYLKDIQGRVPETIWFGKEVGTTREAAQEFKNLFGGENFFETPKPTRLIRRMLEVATERESDDIILDFFAGSCTTAQAVLEFNREDGGNRRFICVQLPEPTGNKDFPTIAEIGKERIRRAIAKMREGVKGKLDLKNGESNEDLGFKVYKLAESSFRQWTDYEGDDQQAYLKQMEIWVENPMVEGWVPENVIYEVAIKEGYGLNLRIEPMKNVAGQTVYRVADPEHEQSFYLCLEETLRLAELKPLGLNRDTLFICRDNALDDETAMNLALRSRLKTI